MVKFVQKSFFKREIFIKFCNKIGIFEKNSFLKRSISGEKVRL